MSADLTRIHCANEGNNELLLTHGSGPQGEELFAAVVQSLRLHPQEHPTLGRVYPHPEGSLSALSREITAEALRLHVADWRLRVE